MATFADLSTLLMCFFVLLLSFSELNVEKYKMIVGSMKNAFGVQKEVFARESPTGVSFVAREFSPGKPDPSPINIIQQQTSIQQMPFVDVQQEGNPEAAEGARNDGFARQRPAPDRAEAQAESDLQRLAQLLKDEVRRGLVELEREGQLVTIRIRETGSFPSGSATLIEPFTPVIEKIGRALEQIEGELLIAGHTDNVPINTERFRSNWELSAARAVTVVHKLAELSDVRPGRITLQGHGETRPLVANDSWQNRARNRRVEIIIMKGQGSAGSRGVDEIAPSQNP